ncbi:MAG: hypothetical protein HY527_00420 [Betaproteobacteria bacterium]|nr:hypothetical protein [Betaproteobacteria bacterium]
MTIMATKSTGLNAARYFYMVTFEIAPEDEAEFNEIYDTEHIPNLLRVDGVHGIIRFKDAAPNAAGWLVYSALYLLARPDLPDTPEWKTASDTGRWAPVMRPRLKSRQRRLGPIVAAELVNAAG